MLKKLDPPLSNLEDLIKETLPADIISQKPLKFSEDAESDGQLLEGVESTALSVLLEADRKDRIKERETTSRTDVKESRSLIGAGYYNTIVPAVIQRNVLESPAWYTSYTPYQAEISQGRLESLLNFQTLVSDLTALPIANASLLDEATAAAEAMTMALNSLPMSKQKRGGKAFVVSSLCHPQTIAVLDSRARGFGIKIVVGELFENDFKLIREQGDDLIGVLAQYPDTEGGVFDYQAMSDVIHEKGATFSVATDLLALTVLKAPGEFGADIAFGNAQRFGVPLGYGGPHAAFFAVSDKAKRKIPGRLIGVSKDRLGHRALRLALQTREQHIRREKATSNVCTAQALLANMSAFYAIYHGPEGLKAIAERTRTLTRLLQKSLTDQGVTIATKGTRSDGMVLFDTLVIEDEPVVIEAVSKTSEAFGYNLRCISSKKLGISLDEAATPEIVYELAAIFSSARSRASSQSSKQVLEQHVSAEQQSDLQTSKEVTDSSLPAEIARKSKYLQNPVFNTHHSETEMLRYIHHLQSKDLSLVHSMIPLGSCTMKLNATTEMYSLSQLRMPKIHPFAPISQTGGIRDMITRLQRYLSIITGMADTTLQPNSGAQGEFTGLRVIKKYLEVNGSTNRNICLIPVSAHGTNPASAAMAGMKVVPLKCDTKTGNLDINDLQAKCEAHKDDLAAIMVTYPSTFGVFEPQIKEVCDLVHQHGGQVYMDGANLNAQIGLCNPGEIGADVCHLNLHKTFCIPHGGGGPGVGPIAVKKHLTPFLPTHPFVDPNPGPDRSNAISPVSAAPWGSASILPISDIYIRMMGAEGLTQQTKIALLNANYIMSRLRPHYPILYTNANSRCAHEFILDVRKFKESCGIEAIDVAKRLQDYGFHAPTMSWPVANTLMIEPTESESKDELDRFCDALISIREEIAEIERGDQPKQGNVLKNSPHPQRDLLIGEWDRPYSREKAAYPLDYLKEKKFWPSVARVDDGKSLYV